MTWETSLGSSTLSRGRDSEHPTILVPAKSVIDSPLPLEAACSYAASTQGAVLIGQIEVLPLSLPLDAERAVFREERIKVYEIVERVSASYRCAVTFTAQPARDWATGTARLARGCEAVAIYTAARRVRWLPGWWLPRDLRRLLTCAPCPVYMIHAPGGEPRQTAPNLIPGLEGATPRTDHFPFFDPGEHYG